MRHTAAPTPTFPQGVAGEKWESPFTSCVEASRAGLWVTPQPKRPAPGQPLHGRCLSGGIPGRSHDLSPLGPGGPTQGWPGVLVYELGLEPPTLTLILQLSYLGASVPCLPAVLGGRPGHRHQLLPGEGERWDANMQDSLGSCSGVQKTALLLMSWVLNVFGPEPFCLLASANSSHSDSYARVGPAWVYGPVKRGFACPATMRASPGQLLCSPRAHAGPSIASPRSASLE